MSKGKSGTVKLKDEKLTPIVEAAFYESDEKACDTFGITPETLGRYKREFNLRFPERLSKLKTMQKLQSTFSPEELNSIAKSGKHGKRITNVCSRDFDGERIRFSVMSDTHFGSVFFSEELYLSALAEIKKQECKFIIHSGDVTDGFSTRDQHVFELTHIGYEAQKQYATELMSEWDKPWYVCSGNHDDWYIARGGGYLVKDICSNIPEARYLGENQGDIIINGVNIRLFHGLDGSSYAVSYRAQKVIESFTGGDKPQLLVMGHTHKAFYLFERNVHAVSAGALSLQTSWMKGKKLSNHTGFWICEMNVKDGEIMSFKSEWFPFYV